MSDVYMTSVMVGCGLVVGAGIGVYVLKAAAAICELIDDGIEAAKRRMS